MQIDTSVRPPHSREQRHLRAHADRVGHFTCPHCAKEFSVKHKFQRHLRLHVAERRFACVVCGRAFLQREFLARHALTHSGATPFACATCGKAFNQLVNLRQHQERVHRVEGRALRHECGVCDKVSHTKLDKTRTHSGFAIEENLFVTLCE